MNEHGKPKLSDAIPRQRPDDAGTPEPTHDLIAEQTREDEESDQAAGAQSSIRARMVEIGRGNQQAGRQGQ